MNTLKEQCDQGLNCLHMPFCQKLLCAKFLVKFFFMQLFQKILSEMAKYVDPDQTAPSGAVCSGFSLFAYAILSKTLV